MARKYTLKQRAASQAGTRQRIVEAAIALHEAVGDAETTVAAIAERAGVGRVTVYRHFPDERSLFTACTSQYFAANPPPDAAAWTGIDDPSVRLETALTELYAYYRDNEGMLARAEQDAPSNPVLSEVLAPYAAGWEAMRAVLLQGSTPSDAAAPLLAAAIGHALAFSTWRSLVREQRLSDEQAVALMLALAQSAVCSVPSCDAAPSGRNSGRCRDR
jgi:AcrR family transcriptional regulator